ncbi:MAG: tetratricopeptide repeat protein [Spirochaetes bacterium]|nr:tetratricopeptide repeat protein [Spirochaetota bacterium]
MRERKPGTQKNAIIESCRSLLPLPIRKSALQAGQIVFLAFLLHIAETLTKDGFSLITQFIPSNSEIDPSLYLKAKDAYLRNDLSGTIQLLEPMDQYLEQNPAAAFLLGKAYYFCSQYFKAERTWTGLLRKVPHHAEAQRWLARLYLSQGKGGEAEELCIQLLARDSENPESLLLLGKARLLTGDTRSALEYLEKGKASLRKLAEIPLELADLYRRFGIKNRSREELELALYLLGKESPLYRAVEGSWKNPEEP